MGLAFSRNHDAAAWITGSRVPVDQLITFGPSGLPAYARVRLIPDPVTSTMREADVILTEDHPGDLEQVQRTVRLLSAFTTTADDGWFCLWDGYSDAPVPRGLADALVHLPTRSYALLHGTLSGIDRWSEAVGSIGGAQPPAFVWPADHAWCLAL